MIVASELGLKSATMALGWLILEQEYSCISDVS